MTKLLVHPKIRYSAAFGNNVLSTELDGGAGRYRLDKIGAVHQVSVQWQLTHKAYSYLMAFYRTEIAFGSLPFEIDLSLDTGPSTTYTAHIVPGTFELSAYRIGLYEVSATLEITPAAVNTIEDEAMIAAYPITGESTVIVYMFTANGV
jgi:hypothetical protein